MAIVTDLIDELQALEGARSAWLDHWYDISRYVLPDAERFDGMTIGKARAIDTVIGEPNAAPRSRDIYDMTSLWAVDRGAAGTLALVTPQTATWHDIGSDDPFAGDPTDEEERWHQMVRDYLFRTRANPLSGFWANHKAAMRCMWAFGTSVMFVEESQRGASAPISYRYVPLTENNLGTDFEGNVNRNFRLFRRSAKQCVERWGDKVSPKTLKMAADPKDGARTVALLHAVYPRNGDRGGYGSTVRDSRYASCYVEVENRHLIGEGGYYEFPFRVDHWQRNSVGPYCEGPVALAIAEVKSLNMLAKHELRGMQQMTDPPTASMAEADGAPRLNLNPRANNPGYINAQGRLLVQPIITAQRPDLARMIMDARKRDLRETLYINLWMTLIQNPQETATVALLRNQERADMLGPIGSSLQAGLSFMVDRELSILVRRGAFEPGAKMAAPVSLQGKKIGVGRYASPLDRLRQMAQLEGVQQLWTLAANIAQAKPEVLDKLDPDETIDFAQEVLGAPRRVMTTPDEFDRLRQQRNMQTGAQMGIGTAQAAGDAGVAAAAGAQAIADNPAAGEVLKRLAGVAGGG